MKALNFVVIYIHKSYYTQNLGTVATPILCAVIRALHNQLLSHDSLILLE